MNTPAHLIFGAAAFGKPGRSGVTMAALIGAMLPDLSLYLLVAWELWKGTDAQVIFDQLYFSDAWMSIFSVDNSFILWGLLMGFALWRRVSWLVALCGGALLHIALDFPFHGEDARPHFWPLTNWKFESPISYWDPSHHGTLVGGVEIAICAALTIYVWRSFPELWVRLTILGLCIMEIAPMLMWAQMG